MHCAQWRGVEHDLTAPNAAWLHTLRAAGWDPTHPTVWAAEGLLLYLPQEDADAVLAAVSGVLYVFVCVCVCYMMMLYLLLCVLG